MSISKPKQRQFSRKDYVVELSNVKDFQVGDITRVANLSIYAKRTGNIYQRDRDNLAEIKVLKSGSFQPIIVARLVC